MCVGREPIMRGCGQGQLMHDELSMHAALGQGVLAQVVT